MQAHERLYDGPHLRHIVERETYKNSRAARSIQPTVIPEFLHIILSWILKLSSLCITRLPFAQRAPL
jgi:hypothetical protein